MMPRSAQVTAEQTFLKKSETSYAAVFGVAQVAAASNGSSRVVMISVWRKRKKLLSGLSLSNLST